MNATANCMYCKKMATFRITNSLSEIHSCELHKRKAKADHRALHDAAEPDKRYWSMETPSELGFPKPVLQ